jgi:hypothetical protein
MKKRGFLALGLIILMITLCSASVMAQYVYSTYLTSGSLRISMISQDPDPVSPGDYVELRWMVTNMGSEPLEELEFRLVPSYPIQLLGNDNGIRNAGTIQGHQKGEEGVIIHYKVGIDEDASEGTNDIELMYRYKNSDWTKLDEFELRIESVDATVVINEVSLDPDMIPPGQEGKLTLQLKNLADSLMKDINVKLDLSLTTLTATTGTEAAAIYEALPFAPTTSSNEKRIVALKPGKTIDLAYDLMVYPDATSRVYKLPVILTYKDEVDNEYEKEEIIGVVVGAEPDVYVVIDSSDLIAGKKTGSVSFKFVNKGVTDIKFLDISLEETDQYQIVSANKEYIGNIDSDDYDSVDFDLFLTNNGDAKTNGMLEFPLYIEFKDANNIDYKKDITLEYRINTAEQKGQSQSKSGLIIVIVIIIMIVAWIIYRRWDKKRKAALKA